MTILSPANKIIGECGRTAQVPETTNSGFSSTKVTRKSFSGQSSTRAFYEFTVYSPELRARPNDPHYPRRDYPGRADFAFALNNRFTSCVVKEWRTTAKAGP